MSKASYIPRLDRNMVRRIVAGCLRDTIQSHGPIHGDNVHSAAKRITAQLFGEIQTRINQEKAWRSAPTQRSSEAQDDGTPS
jgi:hypothetical protein